MTIEMSRRAKYELDYMEAFLAKDMDKGVKLIMEAKTQDEINAINAAQTLIFQFKNEGLVGEELAKALREVYGL